MSIIKPKLSSIASSKLPEFIRSDYQTFVAFIEAYYEFLEFGVVLKAGTFVSGSQYTIESIGTTDFTALGAKSNTVGVAFTSTGIGTGTGTARSIPIINDFKTIGDIDKTLDSFVDYFKHELALNFPDTQLDDRFLLPKLKELYTSKGSEASYKLLFKLLFNENVSIIYPSKQMLRVSDGKWVQDKSIFIKISKGTPDLIVGQYINIITNNKTISVFVDRYNTTTDPNIYECFVLNWLGDFYVGNIVRFSTTFIGTLVAIPAKISLLQKGKNFKLGQIYPIESSGIGSSMMVTKVDSAGGIINAKLISFGVGYTSSYTSSFLATEYQTINTPQDYFTISGTSPSYQVSINDSISSLSDSGSINNFSYTEPSYVDNSYVGSIIASFSNKSTSTSTVIADATDYAIVAVTLGAVAAYPGYYSTTDGFLDDTMVIQDSKYYQAFSYVLKVGLAVETYKSVIKNLLHPAGTEMFGEYNINIDMNTNITVSVRNDIMYINTEEATLTNSIIILTEAGIRLMAE